jgi:hypothetical protein
VRVIQALVLAAWCAAAAAQTFPARVAKAEADGYTLLIGASAFSRARSA